MKTRFNLIVVAALNLVGPLLCAAEHKGEKMTTNSKKSETVLVLGAHTDATKYANRAQKLLTAYGHTAVPINPNFSEVLGRTAYPSVAAWSKATGQKADTVTLYLRAAHSTKLIDELVALKPRRVIFNPNTENHKLKKALQKAGIETLEHCTLVMLDHNQF